MSANLQKLDYLKSLFDENIVSILHVLLTNHEKHYSLSQISQLSGVSVSTAQRIIFRLTTGGYVQLIQIGKSKVYQIQKTQKTEFLFSLV